MGSPWRKFAPDFERDVAALVSREVEWTEPFTLPPGSVRAGGGTTAVRVSMNATKRFAWAKPARVGNPADGCCAAHEKIAADLAHALDLPVPPVTLSRQTNGVGLPPVVALSYEALPQGRPWGTFGAALNTLDVKAKLRPTLSAMWVFHAWIYDTDHNWNPGNALVEIAPDGSISTAFIDYSYALTHVWKPPAAAPNDHTWAVRNDPYNPRDEAEMAEIITRIATLPSKDLGTIVTRMPDDCLPRATAKHLFEGLDARRGQLKALLKLS